MEKKDYTIIGIDGGGTKTRGILYRQGKILATAYAGTTRVGTVGVGESCERLLNVIIDLCEQGNIDSVELDAVVIGLAGVWLDEEKRRSAQLLKTLARGQKVTLNDLMVTSDAELALEGAFEGGNGIVLIGGTGSIGLAKPGKGLLFRCGGWGIELDDEGSGAWIGKEGLTAIVRAIDGRGNETILAKMFAELFPTIDLDQPRTIVKAYADRSFEYQMLTPLVMECAEKGDVVCMEIMQRASYHLMELFEALCPHFKIKTIPVAMLGGMVENKTILENLLNKRIKENPKYERIKPKGNALDGAISIGIRLIEEMD
jgi:glucosamine kinase